MPAAVGQDAAQVVVGLEVAEDPAATVEEHEQPRSVAIARRYSRAGTPTGIDITGLMNRFGRGRSRRARISRASAGVHVSSGGSPSEAIESRRTIRLGMQGHLAILPSPVPAAAEPVPLR